MSTLSETGRSTYYVRTSQKSSFYMAHERERTSGSQEKQASSKAAFNLGDLSLKRLLPQLL